MSKKLLCKCGHRSTDHTSVFYTTKKGETKHYTKCRNKLCDCKIYEASTQKEKIEEEKVEEKKE
jgi:hypothetical protein